FAVEQPMSVRIQKRRRGSAYLLVVFVSMIVAVIATGAILAVRSQAQSADLLGDTSEARSYARSAVDLGRLWISQDANWRSNRSNGAWATSQPIGRGTY